VLASSWLMAVDQGQAAHAGTGFPLRRFNVDISDGGCARTAPSQPS
jgi:hypothetical protein